MKFLFILAASVALSMAGVPRPSARLILLPNINQPQPSPAQTAAAKPKPAKVVDMGEYYVLTPEGKLQMVKYTTSSRQQSEQPQPFAQYQVEYLQYPGYQLQGGAPDQTKAESEDADLEARVEFRDVKPIPAPIYAYNPEPLVRILKK